jgi:hypothetical protein
MKKDQQSNESLVLFMSLLVLGGETRVTFGTLNDWHIELLGFNGLNIA